MPGKTDVRQHNWMKMAFNPVEVVALAEDEEPILFDKAEADVRVGCTDCGVGLTPLAMEVECPGDDPSFWEGME